MELLAPSEAWVPVGCRGPILRDAQIVLWESDAMLADLLSAHRNCLAFELLGICISQKSKYYKDTIKTSSTPSVKRSQAQH